MGEDRDALLAHYRETREQLLAVLDGLTDEQMTERTVDGWSVKDHLLHLALWDDVRAGEVARISAGHASAWRLSGEQDAAFNAVAYEVRQALSLAQARWELGASRRRLLDAIASASARGLDASLYGEAGLHSGHEAQHTGWIRAWRAERGY
ncbi:MAG TPA: DinB family protein [Dehalococcoidia bacterium]|nr:DinB family protein [Dehalococcoidia bacterium]